jgi:MATE family multidrug resistance protein
LRRRFNTHEWRLVPNLFRVFLKIGLPSGLQLVADIAAWALFQTLVVGRFDTAAMAANMFMFRYLSVSFMPAFGVASAVTALVGRYIGAGKPDVAVQRAHLGFKVTAVYMVVCGVVYIVWRNTLMGVFTSDPDVLKLGGMLLVFAGIYQIFDAMYLVYNGALRGAGDTFVPAVALFVLCWGITVGGGYVVAWWRPDWGLVGPWTMATIYGAILGAFSMLRFVRGKWRGISLDREEATDKVAALEPQEAVAAK